jgi:hypothetical protein
MYEIKSLQNEVGFKVVKKIQLAEWLNFAVQLRILGLKKILYQQVSSNLFPL